eukprot:1094211-Rhodomonas_salina.1
MATDVLWGDSDAPVPEPVKRECQVRRLVRGWRLDLAEWAADSDAGLLAVVQAARARTMVLPASIETVTVCTEALLFSLHAAAASRTADTSPMRVGLDCEFYRDSNNRQALSTLQLAFPGTVYIIV